MAKIYISSVLEASIETVWQLIRDFNALPEWFPGVIESHIEAGKHSDQVGCIRNFALDGGGRMREQLLALSDCGYSFVYKMMEGPLPVRNYVATVRLLPVKDRDRAFAEYAVEFDCAPEQESELISTLTNIYRQAFELLLGRLQTRKAAGLT